MVILIDGHNLIPMIPGISLTDPDDEEALIRLLGEYGRLKRHTIEVFFDQAPVAMAGERRHGMVRAVFVQRGITADEAIMARLRQLGKRARNVLVVSSDRQVQAAARAAHADVISSPDFSSELKDLSQREPTLDPRNRLLSNEELTEWEDLFRKGHPPV